MLRLVPALLKWLPLPLDLQTKAGSIAPPAGLADFQVGWYWNLFWTALRNPEHPGFLAGRKNLWTLSGARTRERWDANCSAVMAAFELREIAGQMLWCLPPVLILIEEQSKKITDKKGRGDSHSLHSLPQNVGSLSPSLQSGFAFDLQEPIQIQKQSSTCARAPARVTTGGYSQADFDARDLRKMAKAWDWLCQCNAEGISRGSGLNPRQMFAQVCDRAGITIERGLELEERRKKWPKNVPDWLKEETG